MSGPALDTEEEEMTITEGEIQPDVFYTLLEEFEAVRSSEYVKPTVSESSLSLSLSLSVCVCVLCISFHSPPSHLVGPANPKPRPSLFGVQLKKVEGVTISGYP
jgi:hypothetical protein